MLLKDLLEADHSKDFELRAMHQYGSGNKHIGFFSSPAQARAHLFRVEANGQWPASHDAVLIDKKSGKKWLEVGGEWELVDAALH